MKRQLDIDVSALSRAERERLMHELATVYAQDCAALCAQIPIEVWKRVWRKARIACSDVLFALACVCKSWVEAIDTIIKRSFGLRMLESDRILRHFTHLTELALSSDYGITEAGLAFMTHLTRLTYNTKRLDIWRSNQGTGLAQLTQLRSLTLAQRCTVDGTHISGLTNLTVLCLVDNDYVHDDHLLRLGNSLHTLDLSCNSTISGQCFEALHNLRTLSLCDNTGVDEECLGQLTALETLDLHSGGDQITDTVLSRLTTLRHLSLSFTAQITDAGLTTLQHLLTLNLSCNTRITAKGLSRMTGLQRLVAPHCEVPILGDAVCRMTGLTDLHVSDGVVTVSQLRRLTRLTSLTVYTHHPRDRTHSLPYEIDCPVTWI